VRKNVLCIVQDTEAIQVLKNVLCEVQDTEAIKVLKNILHIVQALKKKWNHSNKQRKSKVFSSRRKETE